MTLWYRSGYAVAADGIVPITADATLDNWRIVVFAGTASMVAAGINLRSREQANTVIESMCKALSLGSRHGITEIRVSPAVKAATFRPTSGLNNEEGLPMITVKSEVNGQVKEKSFEVDEYAVGDGFLNLRKNSSNVAMFAPGYWASVEKEPVPKAERCAA